MRKLMMICAVACLPAAVGAENRAAVLQVGAGNYQSLIQSGENVAVVAQVGTSNNSEIVQNGSNNVAAVAQIGDSHTRAVVQDGERLGYGSIQANGTVTGSYSGTGGNGFTSTTLDLDVE